MAGRTDGRSKNFKAGGAIAARTIVKFGGADDTVVAAAAATDKLLGVSSEIAAASGEPCDVFLTGIAEVISGGTIARGDLVTSDASGFAVTAAPSAGTNNRVIGAALASAVSGDILAIQLGAGSFQG